MAIYELGKIGLNLRGDYSENASYTRLDVVSYNGSSYVVLDNCTGVAPTDALTDVSTDAPKWMLLAQGSNTPSTKEVNLPFDSDAKFTLRSDNPLQPVLRVTGNVVELQAELQPTASISGGTTYYSICTLPAQYAPHHDICVLQQGSNQSIWLLRIFKRGHATTPCKVMLSRYRTGSSWSSASTSTWLPLHATWVV